MFYENIGIYICSQSAVTKFQYIDITALWKDINSRLDHKRPVFEENSLEFKNSQMILNKLFSKSF